MDKEVRAWDTYLELEATVKNMLTSLKAVSELQNPAIRTRHWKQLMVATKVGQGWPSGWGGGGGRGGGGVGEGEEGSWEWGFVRVASWTVGLLWVSRSME